MILMPGYFCAELGDVLGQEHLVNAAMPLPEDHPAAADRLGRVAAQRLLLRVPQRHLLQRNAHRPGRVPAQVLVGEEQHAAAAGEGPIEHGPRVGRRADDAAVPAAKRLQVGRRVDVGDRHQVVRRRSLRPSCSQQSSTCSMSAMSASEQPAARSGSTTVTRWPPRSRQPLGPVGQDVGRFGHEVDAAKGDRPALLRRRRPTRPAGSCRRGGRDSAITSSCW